MKIGETVNILVQLPDPPYSRIRTGMTLENITYEEGATWFIFTDASGAKWAYDEDDFSIVGREQTP